MLILQVLQLVAELPLCRQPLLPLPVNLLVSPLLLPCNQILQLLRVQLLSGFELFLFGLELGFKVVQGYSQFVFVFTEEGQVELGLLTLGLKDFHLLLETAVLVKKVLFF